MDFEIRIPYSVASASNRITDLMTMADGSYDPMGHIQTGRQHPHSHHPAHHHHHHGSTGGGVGGGGGGGGGIPLGSSTFLQLEHLQQLHQRYQQQHLQQQQHQHQSQQPSPSSLENNNNLPAAANHNLFRSEQKKHKRKRLSAVLDKLHHNGSAVNHNNNNVGENSFKMKRSESRSSTEDSVEDVFPYSASPRISVSPLRLNESDENNMNQLQIKQEPSQYLYKQLQYMNPLAFFNYFPQTKLLYQEIARQRSHSDSDLQPLPQKLPETPTAPAEPQEPQEFPLDLSMKTSPTMLHSSPSLDSVIKQEPKLTFTPPPQPLPSIVKGDVASNNTKKSAAACYNLNVSPVVEEMPPGSDVAYMCPVCGQLFSLQDRLAKHMASRHKSRSNSTDITKSYICEVCQRSFARSDMLTRHMRLHTGVKPYSCKVCGQIFSRSDHLSTHQRTHTGEKPYKCPQCPYAACRRDMITRHMRTHTRYDAQRSGSSSGSPSGSPASMDHKPLMLPVVSLSSGASARAIKKESAFATSPGSYVIETKTES